MFSQLLCTPVHAPVQQSSHFAFEKAKVDLLKRKKRDRNRVFFSLSSPARIKELCHLQSNLHTKLHKGMGTKEKSSIVQSDPLHSNFCHASNQLVTMGHSLSWLFWFSSLKWADAIWFLNGLSNTLIVNYDRFNIHLPSGFCFMPLLDKSRQSHKERKQVKKIKTIELSPFSSIMKNNNPHFCGAVLRRGLI